jgi:hypothetical protein
LRGPCATTAAEFRDRINRINKSQRDIGREFLEGGWIGGVCC